MISWETSCRLECLIVGIRGGHVIMCCIASRQESKVCEGCGTRGVRVCTLRATRYGADQNRKGQENVEIHQKEGLSVCL